MNNFDIIVTLFTIVYGLILTDLFASLHKLLRIWKKVKWNWLPLLSAWYLFLLIIKNWWDLAIPEVRMNEYNIIYFVAYGHLLILLYLLASAVLPDNVSDQGINLKTYYFRNHRYFWGLMAGVGLMSLLISMILQMSAKASVNIYNIVANVIFLLLTILLAITKKYWAHAVVVPLFVLVAILEILQNL